MAKTTTLTIESPLEGSGFASLVAGAQSGDATRQVSVQAFPAPGYVFDRWEVSTQPVILDTFAVVASVPVGSVSEVCGAENNYTYQNVARELFTDGTMLYLDTEGNTPAPLGYWGAGSGTYYYWNGGRLPVLQACATTSGGGGGGGSTGGGTTLTDDGGIGGPSGGRDEIRFI